MKTMFLNAFRGRDVEIARVVVIICNSGGVTGTTCKIEMIKLRRLLSVCLVFLMVLMIR